MIHVYSIFSYFRKSGYIKPLPLNNKYSAPLHIATIKSNELTEPVKLGICSMLSRNFNSETEYNFTSDTFLPLLNNHDTECFVSLYYKYSHIIGCITGRPLTLYTKSLTTPLYYIDYLCVDKDMRKKGIAYSLMQTHEHNQRNYVNNVQYSLFKRNTCIPAVVHFFSSKLYGFKTNLFKPCSFNGNITFERITSSTLHEFYEYIKDNRSNFKYAIIPSMSHIAGLIKSKYLVIYVIKDKDNIINVYIFRNVDIMKHNHTTLELCCSVMAKPTDDIMNYSGLCSILSEVSNIYPNVCIENTSHNGKLLTNIMEQNHLSPYIQSSCWYYMYNYHIRSVSASDILLIY